MAPTTRKTAKRGSVKHQNRIYGQSELGDSEFIGRIKIIFAMMQESGSSHFYDQFQKPIFLECKKFPRAVSNFAIFLFASPNRPNWKQRIFLKGRTPQKIIFSLR
jgi:hypothetical protein